MCVCVGGGGGGEEGWRARDNIVTLHLKTAYCGLIRLYVFACVRVCVFFSNISAPS